MKKIIVTLLAITLLTGALFALTACGNEGTKGNETSSVSDSNQTPSIVGEWKYQGMEFIYTFNEDGTGEYNAAGTLMPFTYKIDGDKISILYDGNTDPFETTFSIDGDTLNVVDSVGNDTLYKRVK